MNRTAALSLPILLLTLTLPLSATTAAFAQQPPDASRAQALFDEGRRLANEGRYAEACPKLAASQKLDPGAGTLMNLATCYEKNGQLASAWATFKEAAAASRTSGHADWETAARGRASTLEPQLAKLTITVMKESPQGQGQGQGQGLVIERDGQALDPAEWNTAIPIDSGVHTIRATAPNKRAWTTQVTIATGPQAQAQISVPPLVDDNPASGNNNGHNNTTISTPAPDSPPPDGAAHHDEGSTQRLLGFAAGGAGVVGIGLGVFFGLKAKSTHDEALTHCNAAKQCDDRGIALGDDATSQATVSTILFIVGPILLAGGAALYLTAPKPSSLSVTGRATSTTNKRKLQVVPAGPGREPGLGLTVRGAF